MSLSLKAPVGDTKRITQSDKKNEKFKPVQNKREDVELVQLMLVANGYPGPVDGKVSPDLVKRIRAFQKAALGFKKPDGIVDPGYQTWAKGLGKLQAKIAADLKELENRIEIVENGKTKIITRAEFDKRQKEALHALKSKAAMMRGQAETWESFCADAEKTMQGQETVMMQLVEFTVRWANEKAEPPWTKILDAGSAASAFEKECERASPDWKKLMDLEAKAVKAYNVGRKAFQTFIDNRISTASGMVGKLEIVRETSFAVVEAYMTARIMATSRMGPAAAHAAAAASCETMKSGAGQFGEYLAGNKVTWDGAVKKVATDAAFAAGAGAIGGKLSAGMAARFVDDFAVKLPAKLAIKHFPKAGIEKFTTAFLKSGAGQEFFTSCAKETFMLSKTLYEKGTLTKKDFEDALVKAMTAGMLKGAVGKSLSGFSKMVPDVSERTLKKVIEKNIIKNLSGDLEKLYKYELIEDILKKEGDAIIDKVIGTTSGKYVEIHVLKVLEGAKGSESDKQLGKALEQSLRKDDKLNKEMRALLEAEIKQRAKKLEAAR